MASFIFLSFPSDLLKGNIDTDVDTFKVLLTTNVYSANQDTHDRRDDVTNEVSGTGYTAGGNTVTVGISVDTATNRVDLSLGGTTWPGSTITARYAVYYKSRGGAASADELVAIIDFGSDISSSGATFTLNASTLRTTVSN